MDTEPGQTFPATSTAAPGLNPPGSAHSGHQQPHAKALTTGTQQLLHHQDLGVSVSNGFWVFFRLFWPHKSLFLGSIRGRSLLKPSCVPQLE